MCLYLDTKKHEVNEFKNPKPNIAESNMIVYKVLERVKGELIAPFRRNNYVIGRLYEAKFGIKRVADWKSHGFEIEEGLHAFVDPNSSIAQEVKSRSDNNVILYAKIPKGSEYFLGTDGDIVSNKLIVSNIQVKRKYTLSKLQRTILKIRVFLFSGIYRA